MVACPDLMRENASLRRWALIPPLFAAALLAGCAAPGDLGRLAHPAASLAADRSLAAAPGGEWPAATWWQDYGDPQLSALIAEGLRDSPDVSIAAARLRRASGLARQAGAALLPSLDGVGSVGLTKQSEHIGYPPQFVALMPQGWNDQGEVAGQLNFQADLWGRNRAALAAAVSETRAAELDRHQAELLLATGIASAYVDFARLFAQRDVLAADLELRRTAQALTAERRANGLETRGGESQAIGAAASAEEALAGADQALAARRAELAALLGAGPDRGLVIARPSLAAPSTRDLPEGVTTELLGRRPDIAAARERAMAAASRVKVARADFYPALSLSALVGWQSLGVGELLTPGSVFGTVGPAISLPIFHGGELKGRYRAARADYDEAVANYDKTVVAAYRDTAEAATATKALRQRLALARAAQDAAADADTTARSRYEGGLSNRLELLVADDRLLQARLAVANLEAAARDADIALVRALGGGIEPPARQSSTPQSAARRSAAPQSAAIQSGSQLNSKDNAHG